MVIGDRVDDMVGFDLVDPTETGEGRTVMPLVEDAVDAAHSRIVDFAAVGQLVVGVGVVTVAGILRQPSVLAGDRRDLGEVEGVVGGVHRGSILIAVGLKVKKKEAPLGGSDEGELFHLGVAEELARHGVVEADPREVGVTGVAGEADLCDLIAVAEDDIAGVADVGGPSGLLGAIIGEAGGEGGGGHHANKYGGFSLKVKKKVAPFFGLPLL